MHVDASDRLGLRDVEPQRRSGVALDTIVASHNAHQREARRPRALTAREALLALQFEAMLVWVCAANIRNGVDLTDEDYGRLKIACQRIDTIAREAAG